LEGLLEMVSLEMTTKSFGLAHIRRAEGRVPDFSSCNAEAAGAKRSANKRNREQIGI